MMNDVLRDRVVALRLAFGDLSVACQEIVCALQQAHSAGALRGAVAYWRLRGLPDD